MYKLKPEYYIGIEEIDKEHEHLFDLADATYELLHNDIWMDKSDEIVRLQSELIDYTRQHFAHEEAYMKSIHYSDYEEHIAEHRQFEIMLSDMDVEKLEEDVSKQGEAIEHLLEFLVSWLKQHIQVQDFRLTR